MPARATTSSSSRWARSCFPRSWGPRASSAWSIPQVRRCPKTTSSPGCAEPSGSGVAVREPVRAQAQHGGEREHDHRGDLEGEGLLGKGGEPRLLEPEEPVHYGDQEAGEGGDGVADPDQGRPEATYDDHSQPDHQTGDGLKEEQRTNGGNGAVSVVPEVVMYGRGPHQQQASDDEHQVGDQVPKLSGAPGAPQEQLQVQRARTRWGLTVGDGPF